MMKMDFVKIVTNVPLMSTSLITFKIFTKYMASQKHVLFLALFSTIDNIFVKPFSIILKNYHYGFAFTMTFG